MNRLVKGGGFTLVELLIVIAVVAILAVSAAPSYMIWYQQTKLKNTARELSLFLHRAQFIAVTHHQPVYVLFHQPAVSQALMWKTSSCNDAYLCQNAEPHHRFIVEPPVNISAVTFSAASSYTRFAPSTGLADGAAGSVVLTLGNYQANVIVSRLGRIRICTENVDMSGLSLC